MTPNPPPPPPSERSPAGTALGILIVLGLLGLGAWYFVLRKATPPPPPPPTAEAAPDAGAPAPAPPSLSVAERDERARAELAALSSEPEWGTWLQQQDLLGRFAAAVANIADGESPRTVLAFLAPTGAFTVEDKRKQTFISEKSYARYDGVARVFGSLELNAAAKAYQTLHPLIDAVYAEIAPPGAKFDDTFNRAIDRLTAVPLPSGPVEVVEKGALYAFADPELEARSAAEKHLLRMGPKNQAIIQSRLRGLKAVLFTR